MTTPKRGGDDASSSGGNSTPANPETTPETAAPDEFHTFMVALATDPAKLGEFIKDPDAAMKAAGISDVDQVILKSGQASTIHARLSGQKFSFTPPPPVTMLIVDLAKKPGAPESAAADQPTLRPGPSFAVPPNQISPYMFPNFPIHPQIHPVFPVIQQLHPV